MPWLLVWVSQNSLAPVAFLLIQELTAAMVSRAASLLADVAGKKQLNAATSESAFGVLSLCRKSNCTHLVCVVV